MVIFILNTVIIVNSSTFKSYINDPRVGRVLRTRPGDEGFSLIELVVVIAVLAILAAVALPNFLGVQKDGQVTVAKNTLATMVKECVTNGLRGSGTNFADAQTTQANLNGFSLAAIDVSSCYTGSANGDAGLPNYSITYSSTTGATVKNCVGAANDYSAGCFTDSTLTTEVNGAAAFTGSW